MAISEKRIKLLKRTFYSLFIFAVTTTIIIFYTLFSFIINANHKTFNVKVNETMNKVVRTLEDVEVANEIIKYNQKFSHKIMVSNFSSNKCTINDVLDKDFSTNISRFLLMADIQTELKKNINKPISERIDFYLLDTIINSYLSKNKIDNKYQYAVYTPSSDSIVFSKGIDNIHNFKKEAYSYKLFESDIQVNPSYLMIAFPKHHWEIFRNIFPFFIFCILLFIFIAINVLILLRSLIRQYDLSKLESDFLNNMTHEFKTPITTINLICSETQELMKGDIPKDFIAGNLKIIEEENHRLLSMVEVMLNSNPSREAKFELNISEFNLNEEIIDIYNKFKPQLACKDGTLTLDLTQEDTTINADKLHIVNVLFNLLDNACKYNDKTPELKIKTEVFNNNFVKIYVIDNGIGIEKKHLKNVFKNLYRVHTGNLYNNKGYGLGLSYVKTIIKLHSGSIKVESKLGVGSTFIIILPKN